MKKLMKLQDGKEIYSCKCERCGYCWATRTTTIEPPRKCPKCQNYGWEKKPKYRWKKTTLRQVNQMFNHETPKSEELH